VSDPNPPTHSARCFCGAVRVEATGAPFAMGYCHCSDCRAWSAAPVNAFTLWRAGSVSVREGAEHLATWRKTERSHRKYCAKCGGHLMTDHPGGGFTDVYAAVLPDLAFEPSLHLYYAERVLAIPDGLPKYRDLPAEFGGSGEQLPE
jgi:hypothetical protein